AIRFESKFLIEPSSPRVINGDVQFHLIHPDAGRLEHVLEESVGKPGPPLLLRHIHVPDHPDVPPLQRYLLEKGRNPVQPSAYESSENYLPPKPLADLLGTASGLFIIVRGKRRRR